MRFLRPLALLMALAAAPALAEDVTTFRLDNGLDVVVIEDHRAPLVVQQIWYRVGSADEVPGKSGIAHFLEHLMFKGTEKIPPNQFSALIEAQGGDDNAFTSYDYTSYYQRIAADRLEMVMDMESDRMRNLRMTEEDVTTERQVILEERAQRTDSDPGALLGEQMRAALYMNSHYGIPIIGWRHEMEGLTRDDALAWYRKYYAPNNATLIVAGDVDPAEVKRLAEKYYGPIKPSEGIVPRDRPQEPPQLAERRLTLSDERVSNPYVYRQYLAPARNPGDQKDAAALLILAELLGGSGQTSVLARALQFDTQTAVYTSAFYDGTAIDSGNFGLYVVPAPGVSLEDAEAAMDKAVDAFLANGPDQAAFDRIKTQIRASEIYGKDDIQGLANMYGEELTIGLTIDDIQGFDDVLGAVTIADVMAAAHKVFNRNSAVTGWLTPVAGEAPSPGAGESLPAGPEDQPADLPAKGTP
ncbi:M16 family metallopeptidase [Neotabrizicola sp. sgz301269]|uniref:M16 family metallopeptidase n=1 Tax=Neotabrizicola sp. sgz301269 TaxID=3276282 RepID=UPI0037701CA4